MLHHVAADPVVVVAAAAGAATVVDVDAGRLRQAGLLTLGDLTEIFLQRGQQGPEGTIATADYKWLFFLMHRLYLVYF